MNSKDRLKLIITAVLILVFILAWANTIKVISKKKGTPQASKEAFPGAKLSRSEAKPISGKIPGEDGLGWVRCPFSGKFYTGRGGSSALELTGILWEKKTPQALINGEIVIIGDEVGGYRVTAIDKDKVILNGGAEDIELRLEE